MGKVYMQSHRISLRELSHADLEEFFSYRSDPELLRYQDFILKTNDQLYSFYEEQIKLNINNVGNWK